MGIAKKGETWDPYESQTRTLRRAWRGLEPQPNLAKVASGPARREQVATAEDRNSKIEIRDSAGGC